MKLFLAIYMLVICNGVDSATIPDSLVVKAESGNIDAQNHLGALYYSDGDFEKAIYWFKKAADNECILAYHNLGVCYLEGNGVMCDTLKAMSWFKKSAEQGSIESQYLLAVRYDDGAGGVQDDFKAMYWYEKAAEQGDIWSGRRLIEIFEDYCTITGNSTKKEYAFSCLKKAAEQNSYECQRALGIAYACGKGVERDSRKSDYWFEKIREAYRIHEIGELFIQGERVPKDDDKAVYWFTKAAKQGDKNAMNDLGILYKKSNKAEASNWFLKAAENGHVSAQNSIGCAYYNGDGVSQDYSKALYWFQKAAKSGNKSAIKNLKLFTKLTESLYRAGTKDNYALVSVHKKILSPKYKTIELLNEKLIKFEEKSGYWGIVDSNGAILTSTSRGYTSIGDYDSNKKTFAFTKKGYKGLCNAQGVEISTTRLAPTADDIRENGGYSSVVSMNNGSTKYYKVSKSGRYGLTDAEGKEIVPTEMEALESAGTGYLRYKLNGFWGLMNFTGKVLVDTDRGYTSIGDFKSFNKRFAYTMNGYKGECDATGRQISKIKVETSKQNTSVASSSGSSSSSSSTSSSSSSSSSSNSGNKTTTVVVEHHRDPIPVQEWVQCTACWGSGTCPDCAGSGTKYVGNSLKRCWRCGGRGKCSSCSGQGGRYYTVYK